MKILDIGCGNIIHNTPHEIIGIDKIYGQKAEDYCFETYDKILMISSIQYLDNPVLVLEKCHKSLSKDGLLIIETMNDNAFIYNFIRLFKDHHDKTQKFAFTKYSIKKILNDSGFEIIYLKIHGIIGGGVIKNKLLQPLFRLLILIGGLMGKGHLLFVVAKKRR